MEIFIEKENRKVSYDIKEGENKIIKDILSDLNISLESVLIVKNKQIVLEDEKVNNNDRLKILSVVSGG